jgi:hypothetical protein
LRVRSVLRESFPENDALSYGEKDRFINAIKYRERNKTYISLHSSFKWNETVISKPF